MGKQFDEEDICCKLKHRYNEVAKACIAFSDFLERDTGIERMDANCTGDIDVVANASQ